MLCRKASQKQNALSRISQYLSQHKKQILFKTFIMSQFNYNKINHKINSIRKIALRMVYQNKNLHDLLQKDNSVSIHMKNLQYLATEIYKVKKLTPS